MLRWSVQNGFIPITKSTKPRRNRENVQIFDFELSEEEMELIAMLREGDGARAYWNPMKNVNWNYKVTSAKLWGATSWLLDCKSLANSVIVNCYSTKTSRVYGVEF